MTHIKIIIGIGQPKWQNSRTSGYLILYKSKVCCREPTNLLKVAVIYGTCKSARAVFVASVGLCIPTGDNGDIEKVP